MNLERDAKNGADHADSLCVILHCRRAADFSPRGATGTGMSHDDARTYVGGKESCGRLPNPEGGFGIPAKRVGTVSGFLPGRRAHLVTAGLLFAVMGSFGCPARTLHILQDDIINTGGQIYRSAPTGEPLEVTIVCVYPEDLEKRENDTLRPGITCKEWYEHRPVAGGGEGHFALPKKQIYLLTNNIDSYGVKLGPALRGANKDRNRTIMVKGIRFDTNKLFNKNSAIYVFPRFIGPDKQVLPVKAAVFSPPGHETSQLYIKIGVDKDRRENYGQYMEVTSKEPH